MTEPLGLAAAIEAVPQRYSGPPCASGVAFAKLTPAERAEFVALAADRQRYSMPRLARILAKATSTVAPPPKGLARHLAGECRNCPCPVE